MKAKKVLTVLGTRPEAIKLAPLVIALKKHLADNARLCVTGQHKDMADPILELFDLQPDYDLDLMEPHQTLTDITTKMLLRIRPILQEFAPDRVIIQGDTTSAFATALAAYYEKIPVTHVEAGLRSYDIYSPWPEEVNRHLVGCIADMHCAPTELNVQQLLKENVPMENIYLTGNTVIDALQYIRAKLDEDAELRGKLDAEFLYLDPEKKCILMTAHRRESFGEPLRQMCLAARELLEQPDVQIVLPAHRNPNVRKMIAEVLPEHPRLFITEPLPYEAFVYLMRRAYLMLSDSGGVQEECTALALPTLVMREVTERPEALSSGNTKLVGRDAKHIVKAAIELLTDPSKHQAMTQVKSVYGQGDAVSRILLALRCKGLEF